LIYCFSIGRGDSIPSLSMSCSDKIARWNVLGLQSCAQNLILDPVYLSSVVIGRHCHKDSLQRALNDRINKIQGFITSPMGTSEFQLVLGLKEPFAINQVSIFQTDIKFDFDQDLGDGEVEWKTCNTSKKCLELFLLLFIKEKRYRMECGWRQGRRHRKG
jgi:hypothetical protein